MKKKFAQIIIFCTTLCVAVALYYALMKYHYYSEKTKFPIKDIERYQNIVPVVIIGSGPAGLSSALYAARANMHTVIFEGKYPGGQLSTTTDVENWPGVGKALGPDIMNNFKDHVLKFNAVISHNQISKVDFSTWPFLLWTDEGVQITAFTVIIATGASSRLLDVEGEKKYWGKGVTSCAICDAPFYKNKEVVVIGGGDSAMEEALQLSSHAKKIQILVRGDKVRASFVMQERIKAYNHISIQYNTQLQEVQGDGLHVTGVKVIKQGKEEIIPVDGVFLAIGHTPNTDLFSQYLLLDDHGYIKLKTRSQATNIKGIFAAGDVSDFHYRQAGVAAGDGIKAALDAIQFLTEQGFTESISQSMEKYFFDPMAKESKNIESIDDEKQFEDKVINVKGSVLIDFYTEYCPSCVSFMPTIEAVSALLTDVSFFKVNGSKLPKILDRYGITTVPTLLLFKEGLVIGRITTPMPKKELIALIKKIRMSA